MNELIEKLKKEFSGNISYLSGVNDGMYCLLRNLESKIDWNKLREEYFNECTYRQFPIEKNSVKINMAPHDLFEWFKSKVDSNCL
jgi:hypothetical protein